METIMLIVEKIVPILLIGVRPQIALIFKGAVVISFLWLSLYGLLSIPTSKPSHLCEATGKVIRKEIGPFEDVLYTVAYISSGVVYEATLTLPDESVRMGTELSIQWDPKYPHICWRV